MTEVKTRNPLAVDSGGVPTFLLLCSKKRFSWFQTLGVDNLHRYIAVWLACLGSCNFEVRSQAVEALRISWFHICRELINQQPHQNYLRSQGNLAATVTNTATGIVVNQIRHRIRLAIGRI